MSESTGRILPDGATPIAEGHHYDVLKKAIPASLLDASAERRASLKSLSPRIPSWYASMTPGQKKYLKPLIDARLTSQNALDQHLSKVQSLEAFAQPLLDAALKAKGLTLDVTQVYLRLYVPAVDAFGVKTGGYSARTLSLLQAALHNFEQPETEANYFGPESTFITPPDHLGRFQLYSTSLKIETFAQLCRDLDIGAQYQAYLKPFLAPDEPVSQGVLEHRFFTQKKAMLKLDAQIALYKKDISRQDYEAIQFVINGERNIQIDEQQLWYRTPCVMGIKLHGCVEFSFCEKDRYPTDLIVWIPGDPEHPLKWYASYDDFRDELVRKLTARSTTLRQTAFTPYQDFLSRFITQSDRPYFYKRLSTAYLGLFLDGLVKADTEILVLNTLKNLPGWRRDLRLEVREGDFTGALRASIGSRDSNHRKVLARISDGKYRALDEEGNHLSSVCDFYSSLQHALPDNYRKALGVPHVNQDLRLKKILTRHALPRAQLQRLLKIKPESRPFFLPPRRLVSGKLGYLLSGTGELAQDDAQAAAMKVRLGRLYPAFTYGDINGFFQLHGARAPLRLQALEVEFESLDTTLWQWVYSPIDGEPVSVNPNPIQQRTLRLRHQVRERLEHAWRRSGTQHFDSAGQYLGQHLSFSLEGMGPILQSLPQLGTPFSHVSKLNVSGAAVTDAIGVFLSHFKQLRELDVAGASLTHLPSAITDMSFLERLNLKGNAIVLTPQTGARLRGLTRLRELNLENCPLGLPPDISRMPDLSRLTLTHCNLDRWPVGLLAHSRAREFRLYLDKNPLSHIPDVAPGSDKAATVARTYLSVDDVSREVLERYNLYSESVGIERPRLLPAGVESDSRHWISGLSPDQVATHQALWNLVEEQPGSGPFFDVLRDQARHFELRTDAFKQDIRGKVWRMLEAIKQSAELRDTLFEMAAAPFFCVDAGAQLFNAMGVEVLLHEAYSGPAAEVGGEILALAKGKVRLDELGRIARARVRELEAQGRQHPEYDASGQRVIHLDSQGRRVRDIDEVEIYLTYTAQLAERLNLPWQYPEMAFSEADVTPAMVERAYVRVKALDEGDLVDQLLDQPIWTEYVKGAHASAFASVRERILALTELQVAQRDWVEGVGLTEQQRAELRTTIEAAGRLLGKSSDEVAPGRLMSNMVYDIAMDALVAEEREVMYDLTASVSRPSLDSIWGYSDSDSDV